MKELVQGLPPGPRAPGVIQAAMWAREPMGYFERCRARYGNLFTLHPLALGKTVVVASPELIKAVFVGDRDVFHAGEANAVLGPIIGPNSLLLLDGERHLRERRIMLPPFHGDAVRAYTDRVAQLTAEEVERWPVGVPFELRPRMQAITLEVILQLVIGVRDPQRAARLRTLLPEMLHWSQVAMRAVFMYPWLLNTFLARRHPAMRARNEVDKLLGDEIAAHRADPAGRDDILAMLIAAREEDGRPLSDQALRDHLITMLLAGHETITTGLAWCFERLLRHQPAMRRLQRDLAAGEDDAYLTAVINETLRVRPVVEAVWRKLTAPTDVGGYRLPPGTLVTVSITLAHLNEAYADPHEFRPERFLNGTPPPYSLIPFGGGPRRCIGASFALMEMKTVLRAVLERVELMAPDPAPERARLHHITLVPADGATAVVSARNS